jgi:hypothetical protein
MNEKTCAFNNGRQKNILFGLVFNMHIPNLIRGRNVNHSFYLYFPLLVSNRPLSSGVLTEIRKTVEMKLHQINCLFAKNVMIPNKIVYKPRWECVSFLSRALVHLATPLVNYLSSRQE